MNLLRLIKDTKGRFLTMTSIVALGVAFFVGVSASAPVMSQSVDIYADEVNMKDITVYSNYGFDDADIEAIRGIEGVREVEGTKFTDVLAVCGKDTHITRVHAFRDDGSINGFVLVKGRMPETVDEALSESGSELQQGFAIGSVVELGMPDGTENESLGVKSVTIVGMVDTPLYLNETKENSTLSNQYIHTYLYVKDDAFVDDYYTEVNITVEGAMRLNAFDDEYKEVVAAVAEKVELIAEKQKNHRHDEILSEANEEYEKGEKEYAEGRNEFDEKTAEASQKLEDAEKQIEDGKNELDAARQELNDARDKIDEESQRRHEEILAARKQITETRAYLDDQQKLIDENKAYLNDALRQVDEGIAGLQEAQEGLASIEEGRLAMNLMEPLLEKAGEAVAQLPDDVPVGKVLEVDEDLEALAQSYGFSSDDTAAQLKAFLAEKTTELAMQKQELEEYDALIHDSLQEQGYASVEEGMMDLEEKRGQILEGLRQVEDGQRQIDDGREELKAAERQVDEGMAALEEALAEGRTQLIDGYREVEDGQKQLEDAQAQAEEGRKELEEQMDEGRVELEDARKKLDEAREEIDGLPEASWMILDRASHYASATYEATINQMRSIGNVFPVFFILVAALVCLTTMTRMVSEQRGEIGVLRAIGFSRSQCAMKYLAYAGIATIVGGIAGVSVGLMTFPAIIYNTWRMMYILPKIHIEIPWGLALGACLAFFAAMEMTTWLACKSDLRDVPSQLMRPKAPKAGKKTMLENIPWLWERLSFTWKVTLRNIFRYRQRFLMTVTGVAGCAALLVTGFGIRDSINSMVDIQFYDIYRYDGVVTFEDESIAELIRGRSDVASAYDGYSYSGSVYVEGSEKETANVQVFHDRNDINNVYSLRNRETGKAVSLNNAGVVISEKLAENLGVAPGDVMWLEDENEKAREVIVSGIVEMYIYHYVFMTEDCFEGIFGALPSRRSSFLTVAGDMSTSQNLQAELVAMEEIKGVSFFDVTLDNFSNMVKGLDIIVWTLIISSGMLAFVVLGNLISVNLAERQREIATLKVLGFRRKEVSEYIFRENNVLTFIGALFGLPIGTWLHHYIMRMVEMDYVMFGRQVLWPSYVYSVLLTVFFGMLINRLMAGRLHSIKMVESLKSVE